MTIPAELQDAFQKYQAKYPNAGSNYFMLDHELKEAKISPGLALPAIPKQAEILPDLNTKQDPYHIMRRMQERGIADDDLRSFMQTAKVMFVQWGGQRQAFYSESGVTVITRADSGWVYKTAFKREDFNDEVLAVLEVVKKYVG